MYKNIEKFKKMPWWAKTIVIIFILLVFYSIGMVDLFLW